MKPEDSCTAGGNPSGLTRTLQDYKVQKFIIKTFIKEADVKKYSKCRERLLYH